MQVQYCVNCLLTQGLISEDQLNVGVYTLLLPKTTPEVSSTSHHHAGMQG